MSWVKPAGGFLDVVDVVDLSVLRHRLFPAVWQRSEVWVMVVVQLLRAASLLEDCSVSGLLRHSLHVLVPSRRRAAGAAASAVTTARNTQQHSAALATSSLRNSIY